MQAEKTVTSKAHTEYSVTFRLTSGKQLTRTVLVVEDYSTEADIPQIVNVMFPGAVIESTTFVSTKLVRSFR